MKKILMVSILIFVTLFYGCSDKNNNTYITENQSSTYNEGSLNDTENSYSSDNSDIQMSGVLIIPIVKLLPLNTTEMM